MIIFQWNWSGACRIFPNLLVFFNSFANFAKKFFLFQLWDFWCMSLHPKKGAVGPPFQFWPNQRPPKIFFSLYCSQNAKNTCIFSKKFWCPPVKECSSAVFLSACTLSWSEARHCSFVAKSPTVFEPTSTRVGVGGFHALETCLRP